MTDRRPTTSGSRLSLFLSLFFGIITALIVVWSLSINSVQAKVNDRITVTTTEDELIDNGKCSLREAIMAANTQTAVDTCGTEGFDTIYLPSGIYTLTITGSREDDNATGSCVPYTPWY